MMTDTLEMQSEDATTAACGGLIWYELMTPDPEAAKIFYDAVVGWDIDTQPRAPDGGPDYRMIKRSDGGNAGGILKLTDEMQQHGARPIWLGYVHVADVDRTIVAIIADGGKTMMGPIDAPGVGRLAMITDPTGVPFYIMKPIPPEGQPDAKSDVFDVDKAEHARWNELSTTDQDGTIAFFKKHFGWTQEGAMPMGEMGDYKFVQANGVSVGAVMKKPEQNPNSTWITYFGVDDIDRAFAAAKAGGATIRYEPMQIPGGEYSLAAIDPQGAAFGLVGPRKG